jgi:hypothetical protein
MFTRRSMHWLIALTIVLALFALTSWRARYRYNLEDTYLSLLTTGQNATRYGPQYSDSALERVRIGMGSNEVYAILGEPLQRYTYMESKECWRYSLPASRSGHYHNRSVWFSRDGRVINVYKGFYFD